MSSDRRLRIAVDASAVPREMAGAGVYTCQLVRALAEVAGEHRLTVFARPELFDDLVSETFDVVHLRPRSRAGRLLWEQTRLPWLLRRMGVDVLHSPHHHTPLLLPGVRRVVTFHDVTFLLLPERYPIARRVFMRGVTRGAARVADAIVTPSEAVRRDVIRELGLAPERIVAIPEAAGAHFHSVDAETAERVRQTYRLPDTYVLSVGSLEPGKNRSRLIRAFDRVREEGVELVIVGQPAWRYEDDGSLVEQLGLAGVVRFLGYVPDDDLPGLYAGATLLAFPSLYEGFGLPVLEAMASGTPVVTSNGSAMAEVAGDAALLVDPLDTDALAAAMSRLLSDEALREELRARGAKRAGRYSWERTAMETLAVYERVVRDGE